MNKQKRYKFGFLVLMTILVESFAGVALAAQSYTCSTDITHSDCSFFCESEAESLAGQCAIARCEHDSAIHGGDADCEVTYSRSSNYVRSYDSVRHFLGYAVARPRR